MHHSVTAHLAFHTMFQFRRKAASSFQRLHRGIAVAVCASTLMLTACSSLVNPYRAEVVQGNFVSLEQVQALRPGMTRNQVKDILGTPLIASVFHADRWDYAFTIQRKGTQPQQRKLSVFFQNDAFYRYEGDDLPSESEFAERLTTPEERKKVPRLEATPQELEKFKAQKSAINAPDTQPDAAAPRKPYPPLEPAAN